MELKSLIDGLMEGLAANARPLGTALFLFCVVALLVRTNTAKKVWSKIEDTIFSNWQLGLLGLTGLILSLASGYTTWDGMRNFTGEPLLSGMITFGIQGVMLIVAWLIGESFATGMNTQSQRAESRLVNPAIQTWLGTGIGLLLFIAGLALVMQWTGQADVRQASTNDLSWSKTGDKLLIFGFGLLMVALFALYAASDLIRPYIQGSRVIIRNSMLWVMFLACMATSVFFSFDSLFTSIFPQSERVRAAELRAQNQVAGIVTDISQAIGERQSVEADALFQSDAWLSYEGQLNELAKVAAESEGAIERYVNGQIETRRRAVKEQQERMTSAQSGQAGLAGKKVSLTEEKGRLATQRPELATEYASKKSDLDAKAKDIDTKRVEAMAEDKGVEGTGKEGRGPVYRQRLGELNLLQNAYKIAEERMKDAQKRLAAVDTRMTVIDRELAAIDGDLAKLKGEAETADQRIKLAEETAKDDTGPMLDPARLMPAFEKAKSEFREVPSTERLAKVQELCGDIYGALSSTPETKGKLSGINCDTKDTADAAANLFTLQAGTQVFAASCAGGDKLAANKTADDLFGFARKCLADSALPSKDTDALRTKINSIELARDDKAHRFVVTWNAFTDGNRLAYLALAIAIAIDGLIFMSGLFGANATRSPLSDVPTFKARSASQLESTINAALGPHPYETAWLTLNALRPMTYSDGFSAIADLSVLDKPTADRVRMVLTAGADIGAVETASTNPEKYRVRSELREYLSGVCDKHFKTDATAKDKARLAQLVGAALEPYPGDHADLVLHTLEPVRETEGHTSTVTLSKIDNAYDLRVVRRVLNAGSTLGVVAPAKPDKANQFDDVYFIRPVLYEILLAILATTPKSANFDLERRRFLGIQEAPAIDAGRLNEVRQPIAEQPAQPRITQAAPRLAALTQAEQEQLIAHYREQLFNSIGLRSDLVDQRLTSPIAQTAVLDAWKSLLAVGRANPDLAAYLETFKKSQENQLVKTMSALARQDDIHPQKRTLLDRVEGEIVDNFSLYMLFPEFGMISYLIEQLEFAAQPDEGLRNEEHYLLEQLKFVRDGLNELNLNDPHSWEEINHRLSPQRIKRMPDFLSRPPIRDRGI